MTPTQSRIGLIGLGLLGSAIAERLLGAGWTVTGFDLDASKRDALSKLGGEAAPSAAHVCHAAHRIVLSLPTSEIAEAVITEVWDALQPGTVAIDTTTGAPEQMERNAARLHERGVDYLEATVAGSSAQLRAGQAILFLGGVPARIQELQPLFQSLTEQAFPLGPVGAASRFKLVHNLLLGLNRAALAETLVFAERLGFPGERTLEILQQTPAASRVMSSKGGKMVQREFDPQARLRQHLKDVRLILQEAQRVEAATPFSALHRTLLEHAESLGFADADNSAVIEALRQPRAE